MSPNRMTRDKILIQEFVQSLDANLEGNNKYNYTCPKCGKQFKSILSLEIHLDTFSHDDPPEDYDPANPEWKPKKRDERLKERKFKTIIF